MSFDSNGAAIGNAAKIAADLTTAAYTTGTTPAELLGAWASMFADITDVVLERQQNPAAAAAVDRAVAAVTAAFPGSEVVSPPPASPSAPAPAAAPSPSPSAAPAAGADPLEQVWLMFKADFDAGRLGDNWWDNRDNKKNPRSPDYKHKSYKLPGEAYPVGLWRDDRKNPAWVPGWLAQVGL
jgi:hypothetical protein